MKRYFYTITSLVIIIFFYSCKAAKVWENANKNAHHYIKSVEATSATTVRVTFSEEVDQISAENALNYSIPNLTVISAARDGSDYSVVILTTILQVDIDYTLHVTGVENTSGNTIGSPSSMSFFGDAAPMIKSANSINTTTIWIYISEPVNQTSAENTANYTISPPITVSTAARDSSDYSKIILTTSSQTDGTSYKLTITNVTDLTGNTIGSPNYEYFTGTGGVDNTHPCVLSAMLIDSNTVELLFSEPMNAATINNTGSYTIKDPNDNTVVISAATPLADTSRVWLDISATFSEHIYTLTVDPAVPVSVEDLNGNSLKDSPENRAAFQGLGQMPNSFSDGPVIVDPLGDVSNNFSMLANYKGRIYLGPADADNSIFRMRPDGSEPEIVKFIFHGDIGEGHGDTTSLNPGPDNEDGIDYIAGGIINGIEYLFMGPSRTAGGLKYIYFTSDSGSTIDFDYMDFGPLHPPVDLYSKSIPSMIVFNNRIYFGILRDSPLLDGFYDPDLAKVINVTKEPSSPADFVSLATYNMPRIGRWGTPANTAQIIGIDTMAVYLDRLYIANGGNNAIDEDGGIFRSLNNDPAPYPGAPDWEDITPVGNTDWYNGGTRFSIGLTSNSQLIPADRAFPAMVEFRGNLYIARNTNQGPQLWKFDGSNFSLIADNGSGITNMSDSDNTKITMLIKNKNILYLGFDNLNDGIHILRSTNPSDEASFQVVTQNGFGVAPVIDTIYHAISVPDGGKKCLWLLCGPYGGKLRLYRLAE